MFVLLASLTYAIIEAPDAGWLSAADPRAVRVSALGARRAHRATSRAARDPLIELRFFRSAPFSGATAIAVRAFVALGGFLFLNTLYLQEARGLSPLQAGLYTLPMAAATLVVGPLSGRLVGARRAAPVAARSAAPGSAASALMLTDVSLHTSTAGSLLDAT